MRERGRTKAGNFTSVSNHFSACLPEATGQMFHEWRPVTYLKNNCAQAFKVLLAFSIESYGAAGVHTRESHFPGVFTVK